MRTASEIQQRLKTLRDELLQGHSRTGQASLQRQIDLVEWILEPRTSLRVLGLHECAALRVFMGSRVRAARIQLGISQRELARQMDRSSSWVREIESGAQYGPAYLIVALTEALGRDLGWFYGVAVPQLENVRTSRD